MINNTAIFPGSFDPVTRGHVDVIKRALKVFDGIIIAIGINPAKKYMFSSDERIMMINKVFEKNTKIHITKYTNLTIDICQKHNTNNDYLITKIGIYHFHDSKYNIYLV